MSWDKWNYARSEDLLDAVSARYVSPGTYGVGDLDRNGTWRVVPEYGSVWVPTAVTVRLGAVHHGFLDPRSVLRLDMGGHRTVGLGAVSLRGRWVSVDVYSAWAPGGVADAPRRARRGRRPSPGRPQRNRDASPRWPARRRRRPQVRGRSSRGVAGTP